MDRDTAQRILHETIAASSIPIILGSRPLHGAAIWAHGGLIYVRRNETQLVLDRTQDRRIIRGYNPKWKVDVQCRLIRTTEGWREVYSALAEYASVEDLCEKRNPIRRQSTLVNEDGSVLTVSLSHSVDDAEDVLRRTSCITRRDGTRVEEQEECVASDGRERYALTRTEYDEKYRRARTLEYEYPELSSEFYAPMRAKLTAWDDDQKEWLEG